jgi:2-iminobutanoate/2-iminopropanoate deaminase
MPKKEVIQVNLAAANPNLSPATRFGNLVFVAGQTGRHPVSGEVGKGVREQTHYALQRVNTILEAAGTSLDNVLTVTTHLTKREDLAAYNEEYAKFFPTNKPARRRAEGQACMGEWSCTRELMSGFYVSTILVSPSLLKQSRFGDSVE